MTVWTCATGHKNWAQNTHHTHTWCRRSSGESMLPNMLRVALCSWLLLRGVVLYTTVSKSDPDYEFGDYRGKWCLDHHGFVYNIGEMYHPGPGACPCTCTEEGPVCVQPKCPRIHPRCTRISYRSCCPVCEAVKRVCAHRGRTYHIFQEFKVSSRTGRGGGDIGGAIIRLLG